MTQVYVDNALEIIKDNYQYFLGRELKAFAINVRLYEVSNSYMNTLFENHRDRPFIQFGNEPAVTYADLIEMLGDVDGEDSLYTIGSENTFKNLISVLEDYIKDVLEYLFNLYPHHVFKNKEKIELSKLLDYDTLDQLKDRIIKEKIISLSYNNLSEMLSYIEKEFNIDFDFDPIVMEGLVELTLIRNILVHNKGVVNERFLDKIKHETPHFVDAPYVLGTKVVMSALHMNDIFEILADLGERIYERLDQKFNK